MNFFIYFYTIYQTIYTKLISKYKYITLLNLPLFILYNHKPKIYQININNNPIFLVICQTIFQFDIFIAIIIAFIIFRVI